MQGVFTQSRTRFASKKAFREAVKQGDVTYLEATSLFGNEYDGRLIDAPDGTYYVVGPDPHTSRKWYAQVLKHGSKITVK